MYEKNIEKYKEVFKKEYNILPTQQQIDGAIEMFTTCNSGTRARLLEVVDNLSHKLQQPGRLPQDVLFLVSDLEALCKQEIKSRDKWWNV